MQPGNTSYLDRKLEGICTYPGCSSAPAPGLQLCPRHRRKQNKRQRTSANRLRAERRRLGLCAAAGCGEKSSTYYCVRHAIALGRAVAPAAHNTVDKSARLAARTRVEDGRTRYHGQPRRGSQPIGQLEAKELDDAIALLRTAKEGLAMARAAPALSKVQRRAALHAAVAHADRVSRMIAELCERVGFAQQALLRDLKDDDLNGL